MGVRKCAKTRKRVTNKKSIGGSTYPRKYIYHVLARSYGWTIEHIENLTDLEIFDALEQLSNMLEEEKVQNLQLNALASSAGAGNKKNIQAIHEISRKHDRKKQMKETINVADGKLSVPKLTDAELEQISRGNYDGIGRKS